MCCRHVAGKDVEGGGGVGVVGGGVETQFSVTLWPKPFLRPNNDGKGAQTEIYCTLLKENKAFNYYGVTL